MNWTNMKEKKYYLLSFNTLEFCPQLLNIF